MSSPGLLCLKWNNHTSSFDKLLNNLHLKDVYSDGTIVCHGKFYPVHRFVLSTCSDYFEEIFRQSINLKSKHPFIIVKDIHPPQMEALLNYMYRGEVNVPQEMLPDLIKAAEAFKIKGLAVSDEEPPLSKFSSSRDRKRSSANLTSPSSQIKKSRRVDYSLESAKISSNSDDESKLSEEIQTDRSCSKSKNYSLSSSLKDTEELFIPELPANKVKSEPTDPLDYIETEEVPEETTPSVEAYLSPKDEKSFDSESYTTSEPFPPYEDNENTTTDEHYDLAQSSSWDNSRGFDGDSNLEENDAAQGIGDMASRKRPACSSSGVMDCISSQVGDIVPWKEPANITSDIVDVNSTETLYYTGVTAGFKTFHCSFCSYQTTHKSHVKVHVRRHTGEKPFQCPHCSYKCSQKNNLKKHLPIHEGEGKFTCHYCDYSVNFKPSLNLHLRKHEASLENLEN